MAKRYSGDLTIALVYDDRGFYPVTISRGRRFFWRGRVGPPYAGFGPGFAYDSSRVYDAIASSALSYADNEGAPVAESAELGPDGWQVRRTAGYWQRYPAGSSRRPKTRRK